MFEAKKIKVPTLRFAEFNTSWTEDKLSKRILKVGSGVTPKGGSSVYVTQGIPLIRSQNVSNNQLNLKEIAYIPPDMHEAMSGSKVLPKDVLLNITGASIGRSCVVPEYLNEANVNQHVCIIRLKENTSPEFLQTYLSSWRGQKLIAQSQAGGGREGLNFENIKTFKIYFPEKEEQQKIAAFLSAVDNKLTNLRRKRELLEIYKRGLMQQLFSLQTRFKQDDGSDFPDWKVKTLNELLTLNLRGIDKPKSNYMAIGIRSHMKGTFQKPESEPDKIAMEKLYVVREGDLIVNITFAWEGAIAIARPEDDGGLVSHRFPTYIFKENKLLRDFFRHIISQPQFKFKLDMISPGGAGRNRVMNKRDFLKIDWKIPSIQEQQKIANFLQSIDNKIDAVAKQVNQLDTFKKGLLQKLFV